MPLIRARDLRANIKEQGFERGVVATLEVMMDEMAELRQHMRQAVELVDQCIEQIDKLANVGDQMRNVLQQMRRDRQQGDEHGDQN